MQRSTRLTRSKISPGLIDRPSPRRSSAVVAQDKAEKEAAVASKADELRRRAAQVSEVEAEVRKAQAEAHVVGGGKGKITKKVFSRPSQDAIVSPPNQVTVAGRSKRTADSADLSEPPFTQVKKSAKTAKSNTPRSHQGMAPKKPSGLTNLAKSAIMRPAKATTDEDNESSRSTEDEAADDTEAADNTEAVDDIEVIDDIEVVDDDIEVIDDIEFSAGSQESLVSISSTIASSVDSEAVAPRPGVGTLPRHVQRSFSDHFAPCILTEMGCSKTPWLKLDVDTVQACVDTVYPGREYTVERNDGFHTSTTNRLSSFRHAIGASALTIVQSFLTFLTQKKIEEYVEHSLSYHGEVPFLYRVFKPTEVTVSKKKEKGGYKVVRHGVFQHQIVIDTMLSYYGTTGTKACIPTESVPGENPIGALALVCTAVERALCMHELGFYIKGKSFSEKEWGHRTPVYLALINKMTAAQWGHFYGMLRVHEEIRVDMKEHSKASDKWSNNPDDYFIVGSDPIEE